MNLNNKNITLPNGKKYCFLESKPVDEMKERSICLLSVHGDETNYSLWLMEFAGEEEACFWSYEGDDANYLINELL